MSHSKLLSITSSILLAVLLAFIAKTAISAIAGKSSSPTGVNHALVIGINQYARWPELKSPDKDAEAIAKVLIEKYDFKKSNIVLLTDKTKDKPTLSNIINYLDKFTAELTENDNLLIFFSGHSKEDDDGETYWIPKDGKKTSRLTWLKHSAIAEEYFTSENFKAKNLCIVSDSPFLNKLIKSRPISLTPFDLRYPEKIVEKAALRSREVISFGDHHWPGTQKTDGLGLFAYYIRKALVENKLEIIDIENLVFDENILFAVSKIAGTKMIRGRFRTPMDDGGQFIINKLGPIPVIDVLAAKVSPQKGYPGDRFVIKAETSAPASEVFVEVQGKRHRMKGAGTQWEFSASSDKVGNTPFVVAAINEREIEGKPRQGAFITIRRQAEVANVTAVQVEPKSGIQGDSYRFNITTDSPASKVDLIVKDRRYPMKGAGTEWSLSRQIEDIGTIPFSAVATNEDGVQGAPRDGTFQLKAAPVHILSAKASPESGYAGEEFTITAKTNRPASSVSIQLNGETYAMEGAGNQWRLKKSIPDIGEKKFVVVAKNTAGIAGQSKTGVLITKKSPVPIPDVAAVDVSIVSPGRGYPGDRFEFRVSTSAASESVYVDIDGTQYPMEGTGTAWRYVARIDKLGDSSYQVIAKNKDGARGQSREGIITTTRKPLEPVTVVSAQVSPEKGFAGKEFTFKASTDRPAKGVTLVVGKNSYEMTGSGTDWQFSKKLEQTGDFKLQIVARNAEDTQGPVKTAALTVEKEIKGYNYNPDGTVTNRKTGAVSARFVDNGDGTVTDLLTSLMWLKQPKTIAVDYENAVEYCRTLDFKGYTGWRLPTISEWKRLVDTKQRNPALPPRHPFGNVLTHIGYWSKSKHKFGPQYVYQMNLWYGKTGHIKKQENSVVWPVRYVELEKEG